MADLPKLTRRYQNHHLDSTRWDLYEPRDGDVLVTTAYKSGTTWMQLIVLQLAHLGQKEVPTIEDASPWPDMRLRLTRDELAEKLASLDGRRCIKSHLPLDGLPYHPEVRYVVVGRDPRDVFMSLFNHYGNYTDVIYELMNQSPDLVGEPLPRCPEDPRELWRDWITRGWFEWESEGYPFWSNLHHTQTYWNYRHLPNIRFFHYNDLLEDLEGGVEQVADYLGFEVTAEDVAKVARATRFDTVKKNAEKLMPGADLGFKGGAQSFFFKGTNGRWKGLLTREDLALYEEAKKRVLTPDCAAWLEQGWLGLR